MFWKFWHKDNDGPLAPPPAVKACKASGTPCKKTVPPLSHCEKCGACCAFFPVSFVGGEQGDVGNIAVLERMSVPAGLSRRVMKGTEGAHPRCIALEGDIGLRVGCTIYDGRPSTCRNFTRSWENNIGNTLCDRARAVYGLQPFSQY